MKKIFCIVSLLFFSFSLCTTATSPAVEPSVGDLVYRGEAQELHDLVYRGEPVDVILLDKVEVVD